MCPEVAGGGARLFEHGLPASSWSLRHSAITESGALCLLYDRIREVKITADGVDIEAGPGDIVVVSAETPHKFKNIGTGRLDIIRIHSSPCIIQEWLAE
ncbi:MAG: hypothetical protein HY870_04205 [Chloroflexi bacterium]|nr:hypothetical protein [Chloroflexota bacterium]